MKSSIILQHLPIYIDTEAVFACLPFYLKLPTPKHPIGRSVGRRHKCEISLCPPLISSTMNGNQGPNFFFTTIIQRDEKL